MKCIRLLLIFVALLAVQRSPLCSASADEPKQLTFGIYSYDNPSQIYHDFEPLIKYLSKELGTQLKIIIAPNYMSHIINIGEGRVDLGFMGPSPYIRAKDKYGSVELIARLLMRSNKNDRLVIITHKNSGIQTLKDLKGKTFAFGDVQSYGSHFYPRYLLNKAGVKLKDLKSYEYLGSHSRVILAVAHRDFDAGGVREDIYDRYEGRPVRLIAGPFETPPHVIVSRKGLPESTKKRIREVLLGIEDKIVLKSIDAALERFAPVKDDDFKQAREVVNYIEDR